ncbi:hypothetical protein B296_00044466 [Ensete ventricosum]|uniref:Uncharacterized protein n=1 Tax=Ensete ventricosum TaxID=4639 RepID=A0A426XIJ8_ENSVE|nr:hypothetical protein B296_00044466 [Ensete ventricosum]
MGATGRSYLRSLLPIWLTMSLYSFHTVRGPCSEARALPAAAVAGVELVPKIDPTELGSGNELIGFKYPEADPTELGLEK